MPANSSRGWWAVWIVLLAAVIYGGYGLERSRTLWLIATFTISFGAYAWLAWQDRLVAPNSHFLAGLVLRLALLFMIPNLSDDIYRFIWDGQLTWHGVHPFAHVPSYYMENGMPDYLNEALYTRLNSPDYFTVYPPVSQFFFMLTALITGGDVFWSSVVLRLFLIAAEAGTFFLLRQICIESGVSTRRIAWYWLNPLVILEITGNLHFEGLMIFFLVLSVILIVRRQWWAAGAALGLATGVKLIPLLFFPVLWRHSGTRPFVKVCIAAVIAFVLFTLPFTDRAFISGIYDSLSLYFQKFEFNASVYYLVREAGYWYKGYNIIATAGPYLAVCTLLGIIVFVLRHSPVKTRMTTAMGISLTIYLLLATTVHPWYILALIPLMILQNIYYPVLWSALAVLSYTGYYPGGYEEKLWLTFVEYALVIVYMVYELVIDKKIQFNPLYRPPVT